MTFFGFQEGEEPLPKSREFPARGGTRGIIDRVSGEPGGFKSWLSSDRGRAMRYGFMDAASTMMAGLAGISPGGSDTSSLGRAAMHATGAGARARDRVEQENFTSFVDKKIALTEPDSPERLHLEAIKSNPTAMLNVIANQGWRERGTFATDEQIRAMEAKAEFEKKYGTGYSGRAAATAAANLQADKELYTWKQEQEGKEERAVANNLWNTLPSEKREALLAGDHTALLVEISTNREFEKMWRLLFAPGGPLERQYRLKATVEDRLESREESIKAMGQGLFE